jgi:hypothetical protein
MGVFFSGTDDSELIDNCPFHNFYFSLIVNNKNEMCAKVAFLAKSKTDTKTAITFKDENGNDKTVEYDSSEEKECVYTYNCEIEKPGAGEDLAIRFQEIQTKKKQEEEKKSTVLVGVGGYSNGNLWSGVDDWDDDSWGKGKSSTGKWEKGHEVGEMGIDTKKDIRKKGSRVSPGTYSMLVKLLSLNHLEESNLGDIMESLHKRFYAKEAKDSSPIAIKSYFDALVNKSIEFYMEAYPGDTGLQNFEKVMEDCVEFISVYENVYPELQESLSQVLQLTIK